MKKNNSKFHIGLDFDNTIINYDQVFYKYALIRGYISTVVARNKLAIRQAIKSLPSGEDKWTELQGLIYGFHMDEAEVAPGVDKFISCCQLEGIRISVISHKTTYPVLGTRVNLREAALKWIESQNFLSGRIARNDIIFTADITEKLSCISRNGCSHFIDDLPEILLHASFPAGVIKILYTDAEPAERPGLLVFKTWDKIREYFFG